MPYLSTVAISIKRADYRETSQLVTFYSRDFGKVGCIAKGARRPKARFQGGIDLLNECEITFLEPSSGGLSTLTECTIRNHFPPRRKRLERIHAGCFFAELVLLATPEREPNPEIYQLLTTYLQALGDLPRTQELVLSFPLKLSALLGEGPELENCCHCGNPLAPRETVHFQAAEGGVICAECAACLDTMSIYPGTLAALKQLAKSPPSMLAKMRLSGKIMKEAWEVALSCACVLTGRPPASSKYLSW